jgi:cation-transporting ATPase E
MLDEAVRPDAAETLEYFTAQGVRLRVISGDNPRTVAAVAARVGLDVGEPIDARDLPDDQDALADILETHTVFGRVTPQQKRAFVGALQSRGHTVAMTGDGVNDALALKDADIGVAMGSGSAATRSVAQIVLLDDKFARMPGVVGEGRRVLGNVERVANLFVTKTAYVFLLAVATGIASVPFPFLPRHLTLVSSVTIGIPAFFLALAPNTQRFEPGFIHRVLRFSVPAGVVAAIATFLTYMLCRAEDLSTNDARTAATYTLTIIGLWVLVVLARPFTWWKYLLVLAMALGVPLMYAIPFTREFFALEPLDGGAITQCLVIGAVAAVAIEIGWRIDAWRNRSDRDDGAPAAAPDERATTSPVS